MENTELSKTKNVKKSANIDLNLYHLASQPN